MSGAHSRTAWRTLDWYTLPMGQDDVTPEAVTNQLYRRGRRASPQGIDTWGATDLYSDLASHADAPALSFGRVGDQSS